MDNTIVRYERATVQFDKGVSVDGYRMPDGSFRVGLTGAAIALGYSESFFDEKWIKRLDIRPTEVGDEIVLTMPVNSFVIFCGYASALGNHTAGALLLNTSIEGLTRMLEVKHGIPLGRKKASETFNALTTKTKNKNSESFNTAMLQEKEGGTREVKCSSGNIDLLTQDSIIEVKEVRDWKSAVGQVLCYGEDFPGHKRKIALFGRRSRALKAQIIQVTTSLGIEVIWLPAQH